MKHILLLTAFLLPVDEWSDAKKAAESAVKNPDPSAREAAAGGLASFDRKESVDLLLDLWAATTRFAREMQTQKLEKIAKQDAMPIKKKLQAGSVTLSGDEVKQKQDFDALDAEIKALEGKVQAEDRVKWKVREVLAKMTGADSVKMLISKVGSESDWSARGAAAEALGTVNAGEAREALRKALSKEKEPRALLSILEAIAKQRDADAVAGVADALKKAEDWQVKAAAVDALKAIGSPKGVEPLIDALKGADGRLKEDINTALISLTGVDKHGDHATWKDWYQTNKESLLGGTYEKPKDGAKKETGGTTFYGIPITSKRVCFVLDRSGSMAEKASWKPEKKTASGPGGGDSGNEKVGDRKIDVAKYELRNAIKGLKPDVKFNVIFFSHEYMVWLESGLELATDAGKRKALDFVAKCEPEGQTNIFDPMERAFLIQDVGKDAKKAPDTEMASFKNGVDTIYLMSDGMPNNGRITEPNAIVSKIKEMNRTRKITIHTIAVGEAIREDFMKALAEQNGGTFVHRK